MRSVWASGIGGIAGASAGGLAEYVMTGGSSTWIPLLAGLVGAVVGLTVSVILMPRKEEPFYTPRTVSELTKAVSGKTSVEADITSEPHVGSRIKVSGVVTDIASTFLFPGYTVDLRLVGGEEDEGLSVDAEFSRKWSAKLRTLRIGDRMDVDGRISSISQWSVSIDDCRILNLESPENNT